MEVHRIKPTQGSDLRGARTMTDSLVPQRHHVVIPERPARLSRAVELPNGERTPAMVQLQYCSSIAQ
ncbi:hypothetical protein C8T65DRAFT_651516 [Cerioporus squamosus]|nr:hypothetical protein C8T65DRAFT_651516 [Cerioporus squamosus]